MRRILSTLLAFMMLMGCAYAEISAYHLALELADAMPEMSKVREASLEHAKNRAIWTDIRAEAKCALVVYESEAAAQEAELADATRNTSVCAVEECVLYLDSDLGADAIQNYRLALTDILGVEANEGNPDYILNVNTKKFHYPDCSSVEDMKETNKQPYTGDREDVIGQGYVPCKRCDP